MLSFDISDRQVNIVKGDNAANKIRIEKSSTIFIPEDMILNGEVVNLTGFAELINDHLRMQDMRDKEAIVTFSSSSIVFKEIVVPKAKGNEFLNMVQNHMSQEMGITDEYSISYTVVGEAGEQNPGCVKVLATACPSSIVEAYRQLFSIMGISLKSVNISCNSISRIVLADKSNVEKMPLLVCQIDDNFLGLTLFENGQMAFARYVPISPDDYDTEDYITEALNENIFRMEQFNKARGGPGLSNVLLYGKIDDFIKLVDSLDGLDIKASVLGVPSQITGFENFEFTIFANAIGALYKRNKLTERINLLEVDMSTGKSSSGVNTLLLTGGALVLASAVVIGGITLGFNLRKNSLQKSINETQVTIDECDAIIAENTKLNAKLVKLEQYKTIAENSKSALDSLPLLKKNVFDQIKTAVGTNDGFGYVGFSYDVNSGLITLSDVTVPEQLDAPKFVRQIKALNFFADVKFNGYTGTGEGDEKVLIGTLSLYMKGAGEE